MTINGINANTQAIGEGLYRIICETGQEALVAFGMIPADLIETTTQMLREKVISEAAKQAQCTVEELRSFVDSEKVEEIVRPIMKEICSAIYAAASHAGKMIV